MEEKKVFRVTLEDLRDGEKKVLETNCLLLFAVQEDPAGEYTESYHWVDAPRSTDYDLLEAMGKVSAEIRARLEEDFIKFLNGELDGGDE